MKIPFIKNLNKPQKPAQVVVLQLSNTPNPDMVKIPTNEKGISPDLLKTDMEKLPPAPPVPPSDSTGTKPYIRQIVHGH
jgi:hypothetical protein